MYGDDDDEAFTLLMCDILMVGETAFLSKTGDIYVNLLRFFMLPLLLIIV